MKEKKFSSTTIKALDYYVYVYSDPDTKQPFYVGKGKGNRAFEHLKDKSESEKVRRIEDIEARGKEPIIEILAHGLDEETALKVEAAAIDLIGIKNLTNKQRGHGSATYGKIEASQLEAKYSHEELSFDEIEDNVMLIRINQLYRNGMSPRELYEVTRAYWGVNIENAEKVDYVFAIYEGMVLEVYEVAKWFPAFSTFIDDPDESNNEELMTRYEFVGKIAAPDVRQKYVDKSVAKNFKHGDQSSFRYVWGKKDE